MNDRGAMPNAVSPVRNIPAEVRLNVCLLLSDESQVTELNRMMTIVDDRPDGGLCVQ